MQKDIDFFNNFAENWDATRRTNPQILEKLLQMAKLPCGAKVLDVGSGTGVLLPYLSEIVGNAGKITAVDFSEKMLAKAQEKFSDLENVSFIVGDILEIDFPAESFDVITCLNFYPHLHTRKQEFIAKMINYLRNGGCLIIMHDIPRAKVNSIHRSCLEVSEHRLPEAKIVGEQLAAAGYKNIITYEDDTLYFVKGTKK